MPITLDNLSDFLRPGTNEIARQREQRKAQDAMMAEAHAMCGGDDSDGDTLITGELPCFTHSITLYSGGTTGKTTPGTGSSIRHDKSGWESYVPMSYDAPAPVDNAAVTAKAEATERKGKSLMQAIGAVQSQITSDGRPPRFTIVD